ncbi:hypothetical protein EDC30_1229 [Paucimonas lemoignei]|uniref:Uncharacterized protein n=1 Tax=Paucimonas lemoignei TaxID=29443 RepID=A0A4R3HQJ4_PAULE|nr:hypothetical protein [Paucimonas lemoignei]TCS32569.1 hypothetical protein EDC30_1229 [Paucimonas lemoignei]
MAHTLSCYYLDAPLSDTERKLVIQVLLGPWAKFKTGATALVERRVPTVLPLPDSSGHYCHTREQRAWRVCANLRHAGIHEDIGRQVVWVMPRDADWDAIFQFAIREETGFAPYVVQRWIQDETGIQRLAARIIDTQKLIDGLESQ